MLALIKSRTARLPWALLLVEALAIALSVGLAFAVQEWREAAREDGARREALQNFRDELARNRAAAEAAIPYHTEVRDRALALVTSLEADTLRHMGEAMQAIGWRGPGAAYLPRTAMLAAEATGAVGLLDFETAGAVADAYALQGFLDRTQQAFLTEGGFNPAIYDPEEVRQALWVMYMYFDAATGAEESLLAVYDRALERVAAELGEAPPERAP